MFPCTKFESHDALLPGRHKIICMYVSNKEEFHDFHIY